MKASTILLYLAAATAGSFAAAAKSSTPAVFSCALDGLTLNVYSTPGAPPFFPYEVVDSDGNAFFEAGSFAFSSSRDFFSADAAPGSGAALTPGAPVVGAGVDLNLGAFTFLSVPWTAAAALPAPLRVTTNFSCFATGGGGGAALAAFTALYNDGVANSSLLAPPSAGTNLESNARPISHFPSFAAGPLSALRSPSMGYVEWAGCMTSGNSDHGVGLSGFVGGQQSGPLLLFNATELAASAGVAAARKQAAVLGALEEVGHSILGVVPDPAPQATESAGTCGAGAAHTDQVGAGHSPGYDNGAHTGTAAACCALCTNLTLASCDSWVFDTSGPAGPDCWPCLGTTGSKPVADRTLGFPAERPTACGKAMPNTDVATATPSPGFEAGEATGSIDGCCALCAVLGPMSCTAFVYAPAAAPAADCFPLVSASGVKPSPGRTLVLSGAGSPRLAAGPQGYLTSLPPSFSTTFVLAASSAGLSQAVMRYGRALRAAHRTQRIAKADDPLRRQVSYWSDKQVHEATLFPPAHLFAYPAKHPNGQLVTPLHSGAYYEDDHWGPRGFFNPTNHTPEIIFNRLKAYHASIGAHVGTYQLDPWWSDGHGDQPYWYWAPAWAPFPGFFPSGLAALEMPLTLYSNMYAVPAYNNMTSFEWVTSVTCPIGLEHCSSRVAGRDSYEFHSYIFDLGVGYGMTNFEIDFINFQHLSFTDTSTEVRIFDEWWGGMAQAALEHSMPVQLCMALPAVVLASVQYPAITNARLQGDGFPDDGGRYDIFQSSLLYSAIDLAPFLDVIWTTSCQPGDDNIFNECEPHVQALNFIAALSAGPVGFGDGVGWTNSSLLNMSCRADGVLLQPSAPAINVEFTFLQSFAEAAGGGARIAAAPSFVPRERAAGPATDAGPVFPWPRANKSACWSSVIAVFVKGAAPTPVAPSDLAPPLASGDGVASFVAYAQLSMGLERIAQACADGADAFASGCAAQFSDAAPLAVSADEADVWSIAPVFAVASDGSDGWALLGELGKTTRVSPTRILSAAPGCGVAGAGGETLCLAVAGAIPESVQLTLIAPGGTLRVVALNFAAGGSGVVTVSCSGSGASSACTSAPA